MHLPFSNNITWEKYSPEFLSSGAMCGRTLIGGTHLFLSLLFMSDRCSTLRHQLDMKTMWETLWCGGNITYADYLVIDIPGKVGGKGTTVLMKALPKAEGVWSVCVCVSPGLSLSPPRPAGQRW